MKEQIACDFETGICGPTGESAPITGFIDLSAPQEVQQSTEKDSNTLEEQPNANK